MHFCCLEVMNMRTNTIKIDSKEAKMVAHRGLSGLERENTCPAFVAAGNRSYFGVETDVHVTADGQFVIIHDETTDRVSLKTVCINVEENPYSALKDVVLPDLDGSFNRQDIRIPLLVDYVKICKKYEKVCVLELKNHFEESDIEKIVAEIRSYDYLDGMIYISFDWDNCVNLRKLLPDAKIQWLTGRPITDAQIDALYENKLDLDIYYRRLSKGDVDKLHAKGIVINAWTCDKKDEGERLAAMGVDFITSNILE